VQISNDDITPAYICYYFDETLGQFPYVGLRAGGEFPVTRGSVKKGGFVCSVSGKRRGKGSPREQSPYAELMAGIRVVIAENIESIYNENCQNLGILTSTDFSLIDRIRRGQAIAPEAFTAGGGARLQGKVRIPPPASLLEADPGQGEGEGGGDAEDRVAAAAEAPGQAEASAAEFAAEQVAATSSPPPSAAPHVPGAKRAARRVRPMTIAEKIFASRWVVDAAAGEFGVPWVQPGDSGFVRTDIRFSHEYVSPMAAIFFEQKLGPDARVTDPDSIIMFRDHLTFLHEGMPPERVQLGLLDVARQLEVKQREFAEKQGIK